METTGGRAWAIQEAGRHVNATLDDLTAARPDPKAAVELAALLQMIAHRNR
ncbi:hypothetical protein ACVB8X_13045 [Streptomyces sp. NRAIS4]